MRLRRRDVLKVVGSTAAVAAASTLTKKRALAGQSRRIVRDVCVLGGGSAGTYTAIRLRDLGKSVVVVEKQAELGGHAQTVYVGPANTPVDIGVIVFEDTPLVTSYFGRFGVTLAPLNLGAGGSTAYIDYRTGQTVNYSPPGPAAFGAAFGEYLQLLETQFPYLDAGFQLPNPVPPDLLLSFGDFVTKYGLDALVPTVFAFGQGLGNLFEDLALYVLKNFSLSVAGSLATGGFLGVPGGTHQLYAAAAASLGADAIFNATVASVRRAGGGAQVLIETADGPSVIECTKLVIAFPPTPFNLAPVDLDSTEASLLSHFRAKYYATGLVRLDGLAPGLTIQNVAPNTRDNLPVLPGIYALSPTAVEGYYNVKYGSNFWLPDDVVKGNIALDIKRLASSGNFPGLTFGGFDVFSSHAPFEMNVSKDEIVDGFYTRLNALQGHRDTFYNGAALQTNDSSLIWEFTESLLPQIVA
jgi:Flavin containing amine oxidoreductase